MNSTVFVVYSLDESSLKVYISSPQAFLTRCFCYEQSPLVLRLTDRAYSHQQGLLICTILIFEIKKIEGK